MSSSAAARPETQTVRPAKKAGQLEALSSTKKFKRRETGFLKLDFRHSFNNIGRLTSSKTQLLCVLYVLSETHSAARPEGTPAPKESRPISTEEFQFYAQDKSLSSVQHCLQDVCDRKVITRNEARPEDFPKGRVPASMRGWYVYSAPIETWNKLPAYLPAVTEDFPETDDTPEVDDPVAGEETANQRRSSLHLISGTPEGQPLRLRAKRPSKAYRAPAPIEKVQFDSDVEIEVNPVLRRDGILMVQIRLRALLALLFAQFGQANNKRNLGAEFCTDKNLSAVAKLLSGMTLTTFEAFRAAAIKAGLPASSKHWEDAEKLWNALAPQERTLAIEGIEQRISCGEFDELRKDGLQPKRADKYLWEKAWELPLRHPKAKQKGKSVDSRVDEAMRGFRDLK